MCCIALICLVEQPLQISLEYSVICDYLKTAKLSVYVASHFTCSISLRNRPLTDQGEQWSKQVNPCSPHIRVYIVYVTLIASPIPSWEWACG